MYDGRVDEVRECLVCGAPFRPFRSQVKCGKGLYCGVSCASKARGAPKFDARQCAVCGVTYTPLAPSSYRCRDCQGRVDRERNTRYQGNRYRNDPEFRKRVLATQRASKKRTGYKPPSHTVDKAQTVKPCLMCGVAEVIGGRMYCAECIAERNRAAGRRRDKTEARKAKHKLRRVTRRQRIIDYLMPRQSGVCFYCERELNRGTLHVDHFYPSSRGGASDLSNYVLSCAECNVNKGAMLPHEYLMMKRFGHTP